MRTFGLAIALSGVLVCGVGCSQETIDKAGTAAESAADDTARNVETMGDNIEKLGDEMAESVDSEDKALDNTPPATDEPVDETPDAKNPAE